MRTGQKLAWGTAAAVCAIALAAWGRDYGWNVLPVDAYRLFPLLGLLAFSLMWTHYAVAFYRDLRGIDKKALAPYFELTGYAVLVFICLHPGLLIYQRFQDGFGLPPHSYESYVAPGLGWVTLLGTASLAVFLAFEFKRVFGDRPWWHYVADASDIAMLAIAYHGLRLGSDLQHGWFQVVWWFYAVSLALLLMRKYYLRLAKHLPFRSR